MHTRRSFRLFLAVALAAMLGLTTSFAQTRGAAARGASDPHLQFQTFTLPNGLQVILSPDHRLPMVAVDIWYHVGPAYERPGRTGFAHLFEHMMFQCSKHVPCDSWFKLLESAGASDINGTTGFDRTNYFETLPSNQLELALWMESDRMGYLLDKLDQASLSNQQDVVRNERRQTHENTPYGPAEETFVQTLYPAPHPYHAVIIGSHEDIQAAKLEDVKSFFKQYYTPNNASLVIVGDIDPAKTKTLVQKYFGTLKRGPAVPPIQATTAKIAGEQRKTVAVHAELPRVYMGWMTPAIFKPGDAAADVTASILGGGRSSRLYKKLVYDLQIAQDVSAGQDSLMLGSYFEIDATARPGHTAAELEKAIDAELAALRTSPPSQDEVERARNGFETRTISGLQRLGGVADLLNTYNHYLHTPDYLEKDLARYRVLTPQSVLTFAKTYLQPNARVVIDAEPGTPQIDPGPPPSPATKEAEGVGAESVNKDEPWRSQQPAPAAAKPLQVATPQTATLPNGLTLMLSERRGLPVIAANLVFRTGSGANPIDKPGLANFVADMLDQGTATRSALQIADQVAQLGASLNTSSTMDATMVAGSSLTKNFPALMDLVADVSLHPAFPVQEIERQRASRLGRLVQQRENPSQLANAVMFSALYGSKHPYGYTELGTEASVKALSRDDMLAFWKENFVPNNAALVVAGDISMPELRALAEKVFGGWQRGTPASPALGAPAMTSAKVIIVDKPGSPQTQVRVAGIGAPRSSPDFRPLQVMNMALGGLFSSRINMNLREAHGYTYGASSQFVFRRSAGPFVVQSGIRTDVTAPAVTEILKELRGMEGAPMMPGELADAKSAMVNSLPGSFETDGDTAGTMRNIYVYGLPLDYYARYAEQMNAVDASQALAMAKKYLDPSRLVVVAVGDRSKIEPELKKLDLGPVQVWDENLKPVS
ncbi:MAG TPA: pitrilysin family protein [Vicinamibacterales bacterium]|nr:pitrilysin family protein [Vicinamibacterales bacterium]